MGGLYVQFNGYYSYASTDEWQLLFCCCVCCSRKVFLSLCFHSSIHLSHLWFLHARIPNNSMSTMQTLSLVFATLTLVHRFHRLTHVLFFDISQKKCFIWNPFISIFEIFKKFKWKERHECWQCQMYRKQAEKNDRKNEWGRERESDKATQRRLLRGEGKSNRC